VIALWIILGVSLLLCGLYFFALYPGRKRKGIFSAFEKKYVAHRGLFDNGEIPENSMKAFQAAINEGFPIELDVQLTADKRLVVFHDETLERMCSSDKKISECTYSELCSYRLLKTDERIPLFSDVLKFVRGRVPLLLEIKHYSDPAGTASSLSDHMKEYRGEYAIQSFHPKAVAWYRKNEPHVARGLLATKYKKKNAKLKIPWHLFCSTLLLNFYTRPDFISFNRKYADTYPFRIVNRFYKVKCAAWTVRSKKELAKAKKVFTTYIFDSFLPE